jgi:hypothetical protein
MTTKKKLLLPEQHTAAVVVERDTLMDTYQAQLQSYRLTLHHRSYSQLQEEYRSIEPHHGGY